MLTLYYAPGACSIAAHIVLEESGEKYEEKKIDLAGGEQRTASYLKINPLRRVRVFIRDAAQRQWTLAVTVPLHWRLNAGVTSPDATPRRRSYCDFWASSSRRSRGSKSSGAVSTLSDAHRDFAALGQLGLIARPSVFDRLRLGRGEALAEPLGAARSIKRCLGVALEPRHHLARDQFVTA
jgi:Glutathione S-transferase, N-terminal domain